MIDTAFLKRLAADPVHPDTAVRAADQLVKLDTAHTNKASALDNVRRSLNADGRYCPQHYINYFDVPDDRVYEAVADRFNAKNAEIVRLRKIITDAGMKTDG